MKILIFTNIKIFQKLPNVIFYKTQGAFLDFIHNMTDLKIKSKIIFLFKPFPKTKTIWTTKGLICSLAIYDARKDYNYMLKLNKI